MKFNINQIDTREARVRFSNAFAAQMASSGALGLAIINARVEQWHGEGYIPCNKCRYASKSFHEVSLHKLLHERGVRNAYAEQAREVGKPGRELKLGIRYRLFGPIKIEVTAI